ncbi:Uncharacterised protein [Mycobacteroides abscessus subsp. abscessus]|nr:Uncharacterised protein [Mycobacteroides abscessus subsp. abscessus]
MARVSERHFVELVNPQLALTALGIACTVIHGQ